MTEGNKEARIFLRADKTVDYGQFMEVMNLLRDAGYLKIALVGLETVPAAPVEDAAAASPAEPAP
jgi:biopolymer transport protein ExbD